MTQKLFLLSPTVVFAARVNMAEIDYPLGEVTFDGVTTGAFGDIPVGATVLFGSTAGADDRGRQRVRLAADSDTLFIGRSSRGDKDGEVNLADNDYITVLGDDRRVWARIPAMDGETIYKDHDLEFTDQTDEIPPKANISGGAVAATIGGSDTITVTFDGSDSYAVADGASISSYAWDVDDGTVTGGAGTDTLTATFPAGFRWVKLTVTDSNGKTHFMEVPVYAHDPDDSECVAFQCTEHTVTAEGQRCSFLILEDVPISAYPDGTLVIFWEGEPASATDRSNVLFWGWHQTDSNSIAADRRATLKNTTLHCLDIAGRLDTLPGFPQSVEGKATPASWLEMLNPTMSTYLDYLLRWHSNALELAYFVSAGASYPFVVLASDGQSLWDQVQRRANALSPDYSITCNRSGELRVIIDPQLQDTADRTATNQATITESVYPAVNWERMRPPRFHWLWNEAILAHATVIAPIFTRAPGIAPGQGESEQNLGEQLALSQTALNAAEGHRYAVINAPYGPFSISLTDDLGIEPADRTWVTVNIPDSLTRRKPGLTNVRGLPLELTITYNYQNTGTTKTAELIWEKETSGYPAVTYIPPEPDWEPTYVPPPNDYPGDTPTGGGDGFGTVYVATNNVLGRTRDLSAASPSWSNISPSGTYTFEDFILDPWHPKLRMLHLSTAGVNISEDADQVSPSWSLALSAATILSNTSGTTINGLFKIVGSINQEDYFGLLAYIDSKFWYIYTENGGVGWNYAQIVGTLASGYSSFDIVPHTVGGSLMLYVYLHRNNDSFIYRSADKGATWSQRQTFGLASGDRAVLVHCPYHDNADGELLYYSYLSPGSSGRLYKSTNGGTSHTEISTNSGSVDGTQIKRMGLESFTQNNQHLYWWRQTNGGLWLSGNGGTTWDEAAAAGLVGQPRAAGGFPYNGLQYYVVTSTGIFVSIDGGQNFINKTGNWAFGFSSGGPTDVFRQVIVPVWVQE